MGRQQEMLVAVLPVWQSGRVQCRAQQPCGGRQERRTLSTARLGFSFQSVPKPETLNPKP